MEIKQCLFKINIKIYKDNDNKRRIWKYDNEKSAAAWVNNRINYKEIEVPCGKCFFCQKKWSNGWAVRCVLESKKYLNNIFITLTYNENNLPKDEEVSKKDLSKFIKNTTKENLEIHHAKNIQ